MERGVAIITTSEDWEKAAQHLWGLSITDFAFFKSADRKPRQPGPHLKFRQVCSVEIPADVTNPPLEKAAAV